MDKTGRFLFVYGTLMSGALGALGKAQRQRLKQGFFLRSPFLAHCAPLRLRTTGTVLNRISRSRNSE